MRNLEDEIIQLRAQIEEKNTAIKNLTIESQEIILKDNDVIKLLSAENNQLRESIKQKDIQLQRKEDKARDMSIQMINDSNIKGIFNHYTGFPYARFQSIYKFLVPPGCKRPFIYKRAHIEIHAISLENQLLLTMIRLRLGASLMDLAFRFNVSLHAAGVILNKWIDYMYLRFGALCTWPHREKIIQNMPQKYVADFPTSMAIIDCTELYINKPSSLQVQSQCYSDYKSGTTVKGLLATDPRGAVIFVSELFSGFMSDRKVLRQSGFLVLLGRLIA